MVDSTETSGNILKGGVLFLHNFGTDNTFLGSNAGNLTMTGLGRNTASGYTALQSNTTGHDNTASGAFALQSNTAGNQNTASGAFALVRNTAGFKNSAGKVVLAGLVDTSGYSTAIAEKYQGFLITETKLSFDGSTLDPGQYGFGFKDGKFMVMNVAATDLFSIPSQNDDQVKHPVPLKFEKDGDGYRLYAGRKYAVMKAD